MDHYEKFHCHCHLQCPTSSQKVGQNNLFRITMGLCKKIDFRRLMLWPRFNEYIHILSISYLLFVSRMRNWHKLDFDIRHQSLLACSKPVLPIPTSKIELSKNRVMWEIYSVSIFCASKHPSLFLISHKDRFCIRLILSSFTYMRA